jgi:hypothetical protein
MKLKENWWLIVKQNARLSSETDLSFQGMELLLWKSRRLSSNSIEKKEESRRKHQFHFISFLLDSASFKGFMIGWLTRGKLFANLSILSIQFLIRK